jgi:hypothetical protein
VLSATITGGRDFRSICRGPPEHSRGQERRVVAMEKGGDDGEGRLRWRRACRDDGEGSSVLEKAHA